MKKFNTALIIAAIFIILAELVIITTNNFTLSKFLSPMLTIFAMILVIIQVVHNFRFEKKQKE